MTQKSFAGLPTPAYACPSLAKAGLINYGLSRVCRCVLE